MSVVQKLRGHCLNEPEEGKGISIQITSDTQGLSHKSNEAVKR